MCKHSWGLAWETVEYVQLHDCVCVYTSCIVQENVVMSIANACIVRIYRDLGIASDGNCMMIDTLLVCHQRAEWRSGSVLGP